MAFDFAGELRKARAAARLRQTGDSKPPALPDKPPPTTKENVMENHRGDAVVSDGETRQNGELHWAEAESAAVLLRSVVWETPDDVRWHIPGVVQKLCYLPDVLSVEEEQALLNATYTSPTSTWVQLKHRRLQMFGGKPSAGKPLELEPLPAHVEALAQRLHQLGVFKQPPHHVLVNEYTAGSGIMPHKDGPLYTGKVAIVSLGSSICLDFYENLSDELHSSPAFSVLLRPRSLVVFSHDLYDNYYHAIAARTEDEISERVINRTQSACEVGDVIRRQTRLSFTLRNLVDTAVQ